MIEEMLSTPCNGFPVMEEEIRGLIRYSLSTPCNGFKKQVEAPKRRGYQFFFQLHVMDSLIPSFTYPYAYHVLSTPCNGFLAIFPYISRSTGLILSTPCNGFVDLMRKLKTAVIDFQLHVMDSIKEKSGWHSRIDTFNSM